MINADFSLLLHSCKNRLLRFSSYVSDEGGQGLKTERQIWEVEQARGLRQG